MAGGPATFNPSRRAGQGTDHGGQAEGVLVFTVGSPPIRAGVQALVLSDPDANLAVGSAIGLPDLEIWSEPVPTALLPARPGWDLRPASTGSFADSVTFAATNATGSTSGRESHREDFGDLFFAALADSDSQYADWAGVAAVGDRY